MQLPSSWVKRLQSSIETQFAALQQRNSGEREFLARKLTKVETERRKLLDAYYTRAIEVAVPKTEQTRIATEARLVEDRLESADAHLGEW